MVGITESEYLIKATEEINRRHADLSRDVALSSRTHRLINMAESMFSESHIDEVVPKGVNMYIHSYYYTTEKCGAVYNVDMEFYPVYTKEKLQLEDARPMMKALRKAFNIPRFQRDFSDSKGAFYWIGQSNIEVGDDTIKCHVKIQFSDARCKLIKKERTVAYFEADCSESRNQSELFEEA